MSLLAIGATSGLGLEALKLFVRQSGAASILIGARSSSAGEQAVQQLSTGTNTVSWLPLDLASLSSVESFAERLKLKIEGGGERPSTVLLNAAVYKTALIRRAGGWSEEAVVNHFAQHYLLHLVEPLLAPPQSDGTLPRIIFVSSALQESIKTLESIQPILKGDQGTPMNRYAASKLVQMIGTHGWKERLRGKADVVAVSPGFVPTSGLNRESPFFQRIFLRYILSWAPFCTSIHGGALSILRLLLPSIEVQDLIHQQRDSSEVLYLGVKGERRVPSRLIEEGGAELKKEWMPGREELEQWKREEEEL